MSRKGRGQNRTGRSRRKEQYIGLPHKKVESAAWRALSGNAIKVYLELHSRYWGGNNGKLSLSLEEGARLLPPFSRSRVANCLASFPPLPPPFCFHCSTPPPVHWGVYLHRF